jgi:3-oxoadipate enol-lactonase
MVGAFRAPRPLGAALARALAEGITGASYREIPGSGHCPMLEQPDTLVRFLAEFLD